MAKLKVKHMKKASNALIGMAVPSVGADVGKVVEDTLEDLGYIVNRGKGVDIPGLGIEVKTRRDGATSARQIGTMTMKDIINTPYRLSPIKDKFQQQFIVKHRDNVIISADVYDFSNAQIQALIEHTFEECRVEMAKYVNCSGDTLPSYVRGNDCLGYWEHHNSNSYQFRIAGSVMEKLERMAMNCSNPLFEFGV